MDQFHYLVCGVSGEYPEMEEYNHPVFREHVEEGDWDKNLNIISGHSFYLMAVMWDVYFEFL